MRLKTIQDCSDALTELTQSERNQHGGSMTTERAAQLARSVGSPHMKLKVVHVAGTSGKTSTAYFTSGLLRASGAKVGLTVSPHIDSIAERALINGETLPDDVYIEYFSEFFDLVKASGLLFSYFECMMVFALWVFAREKVDYAVIETGLGGLYDASNICQQANKICVITDIGLDHTHVLGNTIYDIATQKAGIAWEGNKLVAYEQSPDVSRAIRERMTEVGSIWHTAAATTYNEDSRIPKFQQRNWQLANATYGLIAKRDGLLGLHPEEIASTQEFQVPSRMERIIVGDKTVIVDGAHNEQKMKVFFDSFHALYSDVRPTILLSLRKNKDIESIAAIISQVTDTVIVTEFTREQDMPAGARSVEDISNNLRNAGVENIVEQSNVSTALDLLLGDKGRVVLVIGSFFLAAEVTKLLKKKQLL